MMTRAAAALVLALGVSADVPAWAQKKPSLHMPSLESVMAPLVSFDTRMKEHASGGRRLQAIMSEACTSTCPGVGDFLKAMMANPPADGAPMAETMKLYCPNVDTVVCIGTTAACQDSGKVNPDDDPSGLGCICKCPDLISMMSGSDSSKDGEDSNVDPSVMCKASNIQCLKDTSDCASTRKSMGGTATLDVNCKMMSSGCMDGKGGGKMEKIASCPTYAAWGAGGCDAAAASKELSSKAETCCPAGKGLVSCVTKECMDLSVASAQMAADNGDTEQAQEAAKLYQIGTACPDSGMAASKADVQSIMSGDSQGASASSATSIAAPVLVMVAAMVALVA